MKKKWIAAVISTCISAAAVLGLLRLLAPQLLGIPLDLEIVQSSNKKVPFFDVVLNGKEISRKENYLKDPLLKHRYKPLDPKQPTDILGFRNDGVPNKMDVVVIGDSQTWGNNAPLKGSWPFQLKVRLKPRRASVYNASVGGWGAVEYFEIAKRMLLFHPKVLLVAFYTGNDPLDSYMMAYAKKRWAKLRPPQFPDKPSRPKVNYPPKPSELWSVEFADGVKTVFTPHGRYACNRDHPAAEAGYGVMQNVANRIAKASRQKGATPIFTILPTKELAFYPKVEKEGLTQDKTYAALVRAERERIQTLKGAISEIEGALYIDTVAPLQDAVLNHPYQYYPKGADGHPTSRGYGVIAQTAAAKVDNLL